MSDEKSLLAAIRENPADDTLRHIYADWLEDNGQSDHAEFVRVQLELAPLREGAWESAFDRFQALERREAELRWQHGDDWLSAMPSLDGVEWQFERGLPSRVRFEESSVFHRYAKRLFRAFPIERLTLGALDAVADFAASPWLRSLLALDLPGEGINSEGIELLVGSPRLTRLRRLCLAGDGMDVFGGRALERSLLRGLRYLDLTATGGESLLGDAVLQVLVQSRHCQELKTLRLTRNAITYEGARFIAESESLANLEVLSLAGTQLDTLGVFVLGALDQVAALRSLCLTGNGIEAEGAESLAGSPLLAQLAGLEFAGNPIGDIGAALLAESKAPGRLVSLDLSGCQIGDPGATALARATNMGNLRVLKLSRNQIGESGARALAQSPALRSLQSLELLDNPIPPEVRRWLKEQPLRVRAGDFWGPAARTETP